MTMLKNSTWNILGVVIPSLIALPTMGILSRTLGIEQFGLFTLAFAIVGYATIFDAGLTRAVIRAVAMHHGNVEKNKLVIATATYAVIGLSILAVLLLWFGAGKLVHLLNVSSENVDTAVSGFQWLSLSIPSFLLTMIWFSYLEGNERFAEFNLLRTITNSILAICPLFAVLIDPSFVATAIGLVVARIISMAVAFIPCWREFPPGLYRFDKAVFKDLFAFGSWMTISNIISPIMVYFDRFILSNMIGAQKVSFYTAPSEAISRMLIIPNAVARVVFPLLSKRSADAVAQTNRAFWALLAVCIAMVLPLFILAPLVMTTWMGPEYGEEGAQVLRILLVGFIFNALAQIPFAKIQAKGHSKVTAMVHMAELLPYIGLLVVCINLFSLQGAALAWSIRVAVDFIALEVLSRKIK
ncbi:O-antigen/teichoic acid export membrane protein [Pseudomonas duriflava]|uniref:O-antigen/teichoic acid export membrane protein n=1 Tax=Pseudomonas duriflava TaxID=459528 RepID=A0A562QIM8_9PSED|nr:flippase [Pseudomonas duriflava]TWI56589.1 O-antigen/teichoic acid export membrane protein [Pseudomonas duriflava]